MTLLNGTLIFGIAFALVPILLHVLMRSKPKRVVFPALRILQSRHQQNTRRFQVRHLWLLLLRVLMISLFVLAIARPTLPPANYRLTLTESLTAGGLMLIAAAYYVWNVSNWQRRGVPRHQFLAKRAWLRMGTGLLLVLLLALCVGWPFQRRVMAEISSPKTLVSADLPVAAIFLMDTSPSMEYLQDGKTRLRTSTEFVSQYVAKLPVGSRVALIDTSGELVPSFSSDLSASMNRLSSVKTSGTSSLIEDQLQVALRLHRDDLERVLQSQNSTPEGARQDRFVREIHVLTDFAKTAWRSDIDRPLREELALLPDIGLYLIQVGAEYPQNIGITDVHVSPESVPHGGRFLVDARLQHIGKVEERQSLELLMKSENGDYVPAAKQSVNLDPSGETPIRFEVDAGQGVYSQGLIQRVGADPLAVDDKAYFTARVLPSQKILLICEREEQGNLFSRSLISLRDSGQAGYDVSLVRASAFDEKALEGTDVVCLINVAKPSTQFWNQINAFVEKGGGLAVFLGETSLAIAAENRQAIDPRYYSTAEAMRVIPGKPLASLKFRPSAVIDPRGSVHPLVSRLDNVSALAELQLVEFRRYWSIEARPGSAVIVRYTDSSATPAWIERPVGRGKVVLVTSAIDSVNWNDWPGNWTYLAFADQLMQHLSAQTRGEFNYVMGDLPAVNFSGDKTPAKCLLRLPDFRQKQVDVPKDADQVSFPRLTVSGHYDVMPADPEDHRRWGFALNLPGAESNLKQITSEELDERFGQGRYATSNNPLTLARTARASRLGQEMFAFVIAGLVVIFLLEQLTATRFYDEQGTVEKSSPATTQAIKTQTA